MWLINVSNKHWWNITGVDACVDNAAATEPVMPGVVRSRNGGQCFDRTADTGSGPPPPAPHGDGTAVQLADSETLVRWK